MLLLQLIRLAPAAHSSLDSIREPEPLERSTKSEQSATGRAMQSSSSCCFETRLRQIVSFYLSNRSLFIHAPMLRIQIIKRINIIKIESLRRTSLLHLLSHLHSKAIKKKPLNIQKP